VGVGRESAALALLGGVEQQCGGRASDLRGAGGWVSGVCRAHVHQAPVQALPLRAGQGAAHKAFGLHGLTHLACKGLAAGGHAVQQVAVAVEGQAQHKAHGRLGA